MSAPGTPLVIPTIHLNGTSRKELLESYLDAGRAVEAAAKRVALSCPNGRDYYPLGPRVIDAALEQHRARLKKLEEVSAELYALAEAVQDAP